MRLRAFPLLFLLISLRVSGQEPSPTPPPIREEVTVTANRIETKIGDTPASVFTLSRVEIDSAAAPTIDDTLRQSVGFSIFRRTSSRNANPTTQGVSLRGVGASGASRSGVFLDGVPLNDPFGGWVQWNRVSPVAVENVEILRGGASSLYGDSSLSGAINVLPRSAQDKFTFAADVFGGTQNTFSGSTFISSKLNDWLLDLTAATFQTKGYKIVDEAARGPVDGFAGVRSSNLSTRILRSFSDKATLFFRPSYFGEVRTNGTGLQTNRTHIRQLIAGGDVRADRSSFNFRWRAFGGTQVYDQTFSTVNATRTTDALNRIQRVPVQTTGFSAQASAVYRDHTFLAGFELRNVRGASDEIAIASNIATSKIGSGGRQLTTGVFVQDFAKIGSKAVIAGSLRYDRWGNYRAFSTTRTLATSVVVTNVFLDRTEDTFSPRASFLFHLSDQISLYANASRSFRSPTLNELYRAFRVGNVLTTANENLKAERTDNFEGGIRFNRRQLTIRASGFWTRINQPIANVTLSTAPTLITRQRQNAGETRSTGVEIEAEYRFRSIDLSTGYLLADSTVTSFPSNTALVGLAIPQVAKHQFTFQARYSRSKWNFAVQGRASGQQFDDDLNTFRLEPYAQIDLFASRKLSEKLQIYAAFENVFNSRYSVGKTPIRTIGLPTNLRIGIRFK
ncbi:MAG: TonB-dependent receptor [Pyrinomonadaceae bacterium]